MITVSKRRRTRESAAHQPPAPALTSGNTPATGHVTRPWLYPYAQKPRPGREIELNWLDTVFTGYFVETSAPWGQAWTVRLRYFSTKHVRKTIDVNQIRGWRYTDA